MIGIKVNNKNKESNNWNYTDEHKYFYILNKL